MALTKEQFGRRRHRLMRDHREWAIRMLDIVLQNGGNDGSLPHVNMKNAAQGFLLPERRSGLSFLKNVI